MKPASHIIILTLAILTTMASAYAASPQEQNKLSGNVFLDLFLQQGGAVAIAIIIAVGAAVVTYVSEGSKRRRESQIKAYEGLLMSIGAIIRTTDAEKKAAAQEKFTDAAMRFCVWADKTVLTALSAYMCHSTNVAVPAMRTDVVLLRKDFTRLVAAIRKDLGTNFAIHDEVGTITFGDEWDKAPKSDPKSEADEV